MVGRGRNVYGVGPGNKTIQRSCHWRSARIPLPRVDRVILDLGRKYSRRDRSRALLHKSEVRHLQSLLDQAMYQKE
jgi:hypothetical protein